MNIYIGNNRIFYTAVDSNSGVTVTARFFGPDLEERFVINFMEINGGTYYADLNFSELGPWLANFYENGESTVSQSYRVERRKRGGGDSNIIG